MIRAIFFLCVVLLSIAHICVAATDSFNIQLLVGGDTVPPSVPTALTAIPVAQTQIDLSWGASTDNFALGGYQIFRDAFQIATTTLTSYSDTGLASSTSYSYFVRAFDMAFNFSSSSNSAATTTFSSTPATTTPPSTQGGGRSDIRLRSFTINPQERNAELSWETSQYVQFELRWGRTAAYELGFVANELFKTAHVTTITELFPGTTYAYQLVGYDRDGRKVILKESQFTTKTAPDITAPTNVSNLKAIKEGTGVRLGWQNPLDEDFSHVRIVRSYLFYPTDPYDGLTVYQDAGTTVYDANAFGSERVLYYTVFTYDQQGNLSSGAVVAVRKEGAVTWFPRDTSLSVGSSTASVSPAVGTTTPFSSLHFIDIEFVQNEVLVSTSSVVADTPLLVRVPYEKLPEHLKTITITFTHPFDHESSFSFLLRINKDKTYYEAILAPLQIVGVFEASLFVFDYQTRTLQNVSGTVTTIAVPSVDIQLENTQPFLNMLPAEFVVRALYSFFWLLLLFCVYKITRLLFTYSR